MRADQAEFAEFYAAAWSDCLRIVMITAGNRTLSEDLVAEAFTRAWANWRTVRNLAEPRAWVVRVALNAPVSWRRRHAREVMLEDRDTPGNDNCLEAPDHPLVTAVRHRREPHASRHRHAAPRSLPCRSGGLVLSDDPALAVIKDRLTEARDALADTPPTIPASQIIARATPCRAACWTIRTAAASA